MASTRRDLAGKRSQSKGRKDPDPEKYRENDEREYVKRSHDLIIA